MFILFSIEHLCNSDNGDNESQLNQTQTKNKKINPKINIHKAKKTTEISMITM